MSRGSTRSADDGVRRPSGEMTLEIGPPCARVSSYRVSPGCYAASKPNMPSHAGLETLTPSGPISDWRSSGHSQSGRRTPSSALRAERQQTRTPSAPRRSKATAERSVAARRREAPVECGRAAERARHANGAGLAEAVFSGGESRERACRGSGGEAPGNKTSAGESAWTQERAATRPVSSGQGRMPQRSTRRELARPMRNVGGLASPGTPRDGTAGTRGTARRESRASVQELGSWRADASLCARTVPV